MPRVSLIAAFLLLETFVTALATFMAIPFLAVYLKEAHSLSSGTIGLIVGTPPLVGCFLGFLGGQVADRLGTVVTLVTGLALSAAGYLLFLSAGTTWALLLAGVVMGISRALGQPAIKALMAGGGDIVFRYRYITICLAAVAGPLIGISIGASARELVFLLSAAVFVAMAVGTLLLKRRLEEAAAGAGEQTREEAGGGVDWRVLRDVRLVLLVMSGGVVFAAFAQFEAMLPLVLSLVRERPESLFATLLIANAAIGVALQLVLVKFSKSGWTNIARSAALGGMAFTVSFTIFSFAQGNFVLLLVATAVFTVGEVLAIPAGEMLIDRIAPSHLRASYFGAGEMRYLGFFVGPLVAGHVLDGGGAGWMFSFAAGLSLASWIGFAVLARIPPTAAATCSPAPAPSSSGAPEPLATTR